MFSINTFRAWGLNMASKIPKVNNFFTNYVTNCNLKSIFLSPVADNEVYQIINNVDVNMAAGPDSISMKFIKFGSLALVPALVKIFIQCVILVEFFLIA